jgi:hypothetical protein
VGRHVYPWTVLSVQVKLAQLEPSMVEMLLEWSSTFYIIFVSFGNPTMLLGPIMLSD